MCPRHKLHLFSPDMWGEPEENDCVDCEQSELEARLNAAGFLVDYVEL